ncbi:MAG TPA: response regulator [Phototrophicaceae bacterium]|nr:response regulator [Phototrophicaceae bacterium]
MHIVHLEDDAPLRDILRIALCAADPRTNLRQFISSDDALSYISQHGTEIDAFVLDIRVPGSVDGLGVAQKIREMKYDGAIILTSAYQRPQKDVLSTLDCEWLPKPWHLLEVPQRLMQISKRNKGNDQESLPRI